MKYIAIILLVLLSFSLMMHAEEKKEIEKDFNAWKKYALVFTDADQAAGELWNIVLKDGRKFAARKKGWDYIVDLQFGSITVKDGEVAQADKAENAALAFAAKLEKFTGYANTLLLTRLKSDFRTNKKINETINWWMLYLDPEDKSLQDKLKQLKPCLECKSTGKVEDMTTTSTYRSYGGARYGDSVREYRTTSTSTNQCKTCYGRGRVSCKVCKGDGRISCGRCGGDGSKTTYATTQYETGTKSTPKTVSCSRCGGKGDSFCRSCQSKGDKTCRACNGKGKEIKWRACPLCKGAKHFLRPPAEIKFPFKTTKAFKKADTPPVPVAVPEAKPEARPERLPNPRLAAKMAEVEDRTDPKAKLERLRSLYGDGILTEEEFKKAEKKLKLKILLDEGILTQADFDKKMKELQVAEDKANGAEVQPLDADTLEKIARLKELNEEGILTDREYNQKVLTIKALQLWVQKLFNRKRLREITQGEYTDTYNAHVKVHLKP